MNKFIKEKKILSYFLLVVFLIIFLGFSHIEYVMSSCDDTTTTTKQSTTTTTKTESTYNSYACKTNPLRCVAVLGTSGSYSTMSACTAACFVSYNCNYSTGSCVKVSDLSGSYWSKSACDSNCEVTYTYVCKSGGNCVKEASNAGYATLSLCNQCCNTNADCSSTTYYSCDDSTGQCYVDSKGKYSSKYTCNNNCGSSYPTTTKPSSPTTKPSSTTSSTITTTTTTVPPCTITKFELPNRAWVDIQTTASWSTNNCTTAQINCISDDCIEGVEDLSGSVEPGFNQSKDFTIKAPGTYRYELVACTGPIPADPHNDEDCDVYEDILGTGDPYIEIEALHLPWWQEIIPSNLQGFLKGLFEF